MIEVSYLREKEHVNILPQEVQQVVEGILAVLDAEYGDYRDKYQDDGGYVIVVERKQDFQEIMKKTYIDCDNVIAEYVDKILCSNDEIYTSSLMLCNNDYAISLIIPMKLTPQNLINYIIE